MIVHPIPPLYNEESEILILGSFPSVKSREQQFFYGHKQNRFWKVMAALWQWPVPETIEEKKALLYANHAAVWDVIGSCNITGSSDASIRDVVPNDLSEILEHAPIRHIYANGGKAYELYLSGHWTQCRKTALHKSGECGFFPGTAGAGVESDTRIAKQYP